MNGLYQGFLSYLLSWSDMIQLNSIDKVKLAKIRKEVKKHNAFVADQIAGYTYQLKYTHGARNNKVGLKGLFNRRTKLIKKLKLGNNLDKDIRRTPYIFI